MMGVAAAAPAAARRTLPVKGEGDSRAILTSPSPSAGREARAASRVGAAP